MKRLGVERVRPLDAEPSFEPFSGRRECDLDRLSRAGQRLHALEQAQHERRQDAAAPRPDPATAGLHRKADTPAAVARMRGRVHVVEVAVERIEEFPEEMLVQVARPSLQRVLKPQELVQLMREAAKPRGRFLQPLMDDERAALERARLLPALAAARPATPPDPLLNTVPPRD